MSSTVKERLREFISSKGISTKAFENVCGLGNGYVAAMRKGMGIEKLNIVLKAFPELNRNWLLYGEGEMTRNTDASIAITRKESGNKAKANAREIHFGSRIKELLGGSEEKVYEAAIRFGMRENTARSLSLMQDVSTSVLRKFSMYYGVPLSYFFDDGNKSNETGSGSHVSYGVSANKLQSQIKEKSKRIEELQGQIKEKDEEISTLREREKEIEENNKVMQKYLFKMIDHIDSLDNMEERLEILQDTLSKNSANDFEQPIKFSDNEINRIKDQTAGGNEQPDCR